MSDSIQPLPVSYIKTPAESADWRAATAALIVASSLGGRVGPAARVVGEPALVVLITVVTTEAVVVEVSTFAVVGEAALDVKGRVVGEADVPDGIIEVEAPLSHVHRPAVLHGHAPSASIAQVCLQTSSVAPKDPAPGEARQLTPRGFPDFATCEFRVVVVVADGSIVVAEARVVVGLMATTSGTHCGCGQFPRSPLAAQ
mmetsp:Transcript_40257/g.65080  ORF Transcript_40257/g.65080 Transcript_40257/m.65080 type:complete len:200 (+) Transcript_40257:1483-2082(+)